MAVILIVDDETLHREILTTILAEEGYETYSAASGEEALEAGEGLRADIVLTDLKMERWTGSSCSRSSRASSKPRR
jgi:CheY-like chemotaxis protein